MGKNKRLRKLGRKKKAKRFVIIWMVFLMLVGLYIVNSEIQRKNYLENSNLFKLEIEDRAINFLGKKYYLDLNFFSKYLP
ncbi:hypothetical protein [Tissierella creatinophila]|uniref:Uncharacterized protein n=1 Tax=Tissierella creatinophila DSM 6911 TaxID=1123403 RepID=A0A1U7M7V1_TISCR|nr:hypothetical protein [Tissierella creatinophila]OLS03392.1 hypothetical protein TICRE_06220 [Tissierella creatinophila DSM 6911]